MKEIIFSRLFIWFEKIFFLFKYSTVKNLRNNLLHFITLNEKIFLWIKLRMYYATTYTFISSIQREKKSRNFVKSEKLFFDCIAMHKIVWFEEFFFHQRTFFLGAWNSSVKFINLKLDSKQFGNLLTGICL